VTEDNFVKPELCALHRDVMRVQIESCDRRVDGILEELKTVRELQNSIRNYIVFIAIGVILTLFGVIMGRGFDFGWLLP
jgi:uncharacterized membrane protein